MALTGCVDRQAQQQAKATQKIVSDPTQVVSVMSVSTQPVSDTLEITGQVTAGEDASVGAKTSGKLVGVYVKDGDPVTAGQLLATLDTSVQQAQLRQAIAGLSTANSQLSQAIANARFGPAKSSAAVAQAQAQLKSAQANLEKVKNGARKEERIQMDWTVKQAKTNLDIAQKDVDRKQTLYDQGAIPKSQLEQAQNAYVAAQTQYNSALQNQALQNEGARPEDIAVAEESVRSAREQVRQAQEQKKLDVLFSDQVKAAQAAVQSAQAQVDVARQAITDSEIRAPFAGKIAGKPAQPGQIASPGTTVARVIGRAGDYFEGDVPEDQIPLVHTGSLVSITLSALPGKSFPGHVAAINPLGSDVGRLFSVRVSFDSLQPDIKPGMFARGVITLNVIPKAIMIPSTAVVNYKDQQVVFGMVGSTGVKPLPVTTGLRKGDDIQITQGLTPGDTIVVKGQENLNDKSKVRIEGPKTAETAPGSSTLGG
ncbi:MAG TPA: efflux RND transporter periplasmic adaptor subunit [Fimbriimonadaceae bacterium]|nr:efflux RND transporter periplasmic adaptor subunit [Fimbriimonadaceae bacterium]